MSDSKRKERATDLRLRREYGISLEEYNKVLAHQQRKCAICKRPIETNKVRFSVDHCHSTGLLRGLLCYMCNKSLGIFRDNTERLLAAAAYLQAPPMSAVFGEPRFTAPGRVGTKKRAKLLKLMQEGSGLKSVSRKIRRK